MGPLPPGEAQLWYAFVDSPQGEALAEQATALMTPEERERHDRYHFEKNRREFRVTRALARTVLGRLAGADPASLRFALGPHGKPSLLGAPRLHFNLSNTDGLVVCLVALDHEVGVDVEPLDRRVEARSVADRFFSPDEVAALLALPDDQHLRRFLTYWTLKEAYIKACGQGLAIPLAHFSFLVETSPIGIRFAPERPDDPGAWQFEQQTLGPRHLVASAIRRRPDSPRVRVVLQSA